MGKRLLAPSLELLSPLRVLCVIQRQKQIPRPYARYRVSCCPACARACVCVRACLRACTCACVVCVRVCTCACVLSCIDGESGARMGVTVRVRAAR